MKKVIDKEFDYAKPFSEGIACVVINKKYGFIDKTGNAITETKYDNAFDFENGTAWVYYDGKNSFIDKTGKELFPSDYMLGIFKEGLVLAKNKNSKYGFIDKTGKEVIPCQYDGAGGFSEGLAWVKMNTKFGYINKTGKLVVPLKYDKAESFQKGLAVVAVNGKYGCVDKNGKEIIPLKYSNTSNSAGDLLKVQIDSAGLSFKGYLDRTGKIIIPLEYVLLDDFGNGKFLAASTKIQIINRKNEKLVELNEYDSWSSVKDGIAFLKRRFNTPDAGKYVMLNSDGKEISAARYEVLDVLMIDGAIAFKNNNKWGYIDKTGKQITAPRYNDKLSFSNGYAQVSQNDTWFYIDKAGREYRDKPANASAGWVFFDEFKDNRNSWTNDSTSILTSRLTKEYLYLNNESLSDARSTTRTINKMDGSHNNFRIEVIMGIGGSETQGNGLIFGADKTGNGFFFLLKRDRQFRVIEFSNGKASVIQEWKYSHLINKLGTNKIAAYRFRDKWHFYINESVVLSTNARSFFGKETGFLLSPRNQLFIYSFKIYDWDLAEQAGEKEADKEPLYNAKVYDNFNGNNYKWYTGNDADAKIEYRDDGGYILEHKVKGSFSPSIPVETFNVIPTLFKVNTEQTKGQPDMAYGMCFGKKDVNNMYVFNINKNKNFQVGVWNNGQWKLLKEWTKTDVMPGTINILSFETGNSKWKFLINNKLVYECDALEFFGNEFGMYVEDIQTVLFRHFSAIEKIPK